MATIAVVSEADDRQECSISLRLATIGDIPALMEIVRLVVPMMRAAQNFQWNDDYPNPEVFEEDIAAGFLWVTELDGHVAGVIALTTDQTPEYADAGWDITEPSVVVHRLAVHPQFRGKGVVAALMQHAEVVARERGVAQVRTDTNTKNAAMRGLMPKLGYLLAGEIDLKIRPGLRFLCYEKKVQ